MTGRYISIDDAKRQPGRLTFRLAGADVLVSQTGFHYITYLDPEDISPRIDATKLTADERNYIEYALQSNRERFREQARLVSQFVPPSTATVLDIGCGGGLFLETLQSNGARVIGIELSDSRAQYAIERGLEVHKKPIESSFWEAYGGCFDAVCMWDVIEHVNYPFRTLSCALRVLKPGGYVFIDTPCRNSFYHRVGEWTYMASRGRYPTFLNAMYSAHLYGHKQLFSTIEMEQMAQALDLAIVELSRFHELSFPYAHYLQKLMGSTVMTNLTVPVVRLLFKIFKIKNKMLVIARKQE